MRASDGLVSVIIPAYNAEKYIGDAIESVLRQTYPHFEVIVVDDASQDNTAGVVESFSDKRVRLIRRQTNQGPGAARNTALEAAKGRWMAVLDADDQWQSNRLEKLLEAALEAGDGYFVADDLLLCFETPSGLRPWGCQSRTHYRIPFGNDGKLDIKLLDFLKLNAPGVKPVISLDHVRRHGLRYDPTCLFGEDLEFVCHLFRTGLKLRLIADPLYLYRITPGSLTSKADKLEHLVGVYERLIAYPGFSQEERQLFKEGLNRVRRELAYAPFPLALKRGRYGEALGLAIRHPAMPIEFLRRLPNSLRYRLAALRAGGSIR